LSESAEADLAEAAREIDEAMDQRPNDPLILKLAGNVWSYAGEFDKARAALRRAVDISPYDFGAWGYLGFTLAASGTDSDLAEAHAILDRILDLAPQHPGYAYWMHNKALACAAGQLFAESSDFARGAVDRQPALAWAWYLLANSLVMTGRTDEARNAIAAARKANPALSSEKYVAFVNRTSGNQALRDSRLAGLRTEGLV
jgi:tetratricopeptide (TPR) repeat protein